ncbi:MAG: pyridoxamine 5'-phosphate oxidase [Phycisphaerales bacterium]|nr:MAG: pyridoxamine 5'-phosphate oxidase [Phycisphaerales bacterium]
MNFDAPPNDPIPVFQDWFRDAQQTDLPNPNAMTVATVDPDGRPSARILLLKDLGEDGAVFYTNRESRKGRALAVNPYVALLFHWDPLDRQVRIEGPVSQVSDEESDAYFATRPRPSQIGAWASQQSEALADRKTFDDAVAEVEARFEGRDVPRPPHWGGYRVALERIEFWQGHQYRLHDRMVYTPNGDGTWRTQRLYP